MSSNTSTPFKPHVVNDPVLGLLPLRGSFLRLARLGPASPPTWNPLKTPTKEDPNASSSSAHNKACAQNYRPFPPTFQYYDCTWLENCLGTTIMREEKHVRATQPMTFLYSRAHRSTQREATPGMRQLRRHPRGASETTSGRGHLRRGFWG